MGKKKCTRIDGGVTVAAESRTTLNSRGKGRQGGAEPHWGEEWQILNSSLSTVATDIHCFSLSAMQKIERITLKNMNIWQNKIIFNAKNIPTSQMHPISKHFSITKVGENLHLKILL